MSSGKIAKFVVAFNRPSAVALAEQLQIPYLIQPRNDSSEGRTFLENIERFRPQLLISMSYGLRIPEAVLEVSSLGGINFHGGLLPEWRGANILNWVLIEGALETGVTAHWLTPSIDEGPIISRVVVPISIVDTAPTLALKLQNVTFRLYRQLISAIEAGHSLPAEPQNEINARYFRRRCPADGEFTWSSTNYQIYNLIRALVHPWPGAFTKLPDGRKVTFSEFVPLRDIQNLRAKYSTA